MLINGEFSGSPVVMIPGFYFRGHSRGQGLDPWIGTEVLPATGRDQKKKKRTS